MRTTLTHGPVSVAVFISALLSGLLLFGNGLFMLVAPRSWYYLVPGLTTTGFFNEHFIRDIGIIYAFIGVAFGLGMMKPTWRVGLWTGATAWLVAHAVFHQWEVAVGICAISAIPRDFPTVTFPALLGVALTAWAWSVRHASSNLASRTRYRSPTEGEV